MKKIIWTYGIIAGAILSAVMFLSDFGSFDSESLATSQIFGFAVMILAFILIYFGIKAIRDKVYNGVISFGRALGSGLLIALISSTMYVGSWMIISNTTAKDFMANYTEVSIDKIESSEKLSAAEKEEKIAAAREMEENYKNQLYRAIITYVEPLPLGILFSLVFALILKRKEPKGAS